MENIVDLRSDTVTKPTPAMRKAMAEAEVGDDVYGEDPTVNALQEKVAKILGKEAAIFVPSGTMANQLAIKSHTQPGDEVIIETSSHAYNFEGGSAAALSGVQFHCVNGNRGILDPAQIEAAIRTSDHHHAFHPVGVSREHAQPRRRSNLPPRENEGYLPVGQGEGPHGPSRRSEALECLRRH